MIRGTTALIAHIGWPTFSFKSPQIYNPYFEQAGIDAAVVPMGCQAEAFPGFLKAVFTLENTLGALITMPHKVSVVSLLDQMSATVQVAGACNAVRKTLDGLLVGDMFDGEGFVRGALRKGRQIKGQRALVVGAGGVGSAIAASLAKAGVAALTVFDARAESAQDLAQRLQEHHKLLDVQSGCNDPAGFDIVVNATPLGMHEGDALPFDVTRLSSHCYVGEVVMKQSMTPLLRAAQQRGCQFQVGTDMLFEQIPAYLEFFGLPSTTAENLRTLARLD